MKIEELLKLQEEGNLPVKIRNRLSGKEEYVTQANKAMMLFSEDSYEFASSLKKYELAPETVHIKAYGHIDRDNHKYLSSTEKTGILKNIVKTIDLSRDVEKDW